MKLRVSSLKRPFHSAHFPKWGNEPTWYSLPASHASAMSFTWPRMGSLEIMPITGPAKRVTDHDVVVVMPVPGDPPR